MKLRRNIIANYAGQGWSALMSVVFIPIFIMQLGVESYGLIGIYATLQAGLALLDMGMSPTLGREMARFSAGAMSAQAIRNQLRSIEMVCCGVAIAAGSLIAWQASFLATDWFKTTLPAPQVRDALVIIGIVVAMRFCESIYRSALYGLELQVWYNLVNMALSTLRFGGAAVIVCFVSPTILAFFYWQGLISILALGLLAFKLYRTLPHTGQRGRFSLASLNSVRTFAAGMIGINVLSLVLSQADKIVLSKLLPLETFGYYVLATTMCGVMVAATGPISQALFPILTRQFTAADEAAFKQSYHLGSQMIAVAATSIASGMIFFPADIIRTWSGDAQLATQTAPLLRIFAAGTLMNGFMQIPYFALMATGRMSFPLKVNLVAVVFFVPALLLSVPVAGAIAATFVWLALNTAYVLIGLPLLHRRFLPGELGEWFRCDTIPPVVATLLVSGLAMLIAPPENAARWLWLLFLMLFGASALAASTLSASRLRAALLRLIDDWRARRDAASQ